MTILAFAFGALSGGFMGGLAVALVAAADRPVPRRAARVHIYPDRAARQYRVKELWPGEVLAVNGTQRTVRYDSEASEAFGRIDRAT